MHARRVLLLALLGSVAIAGVATSAPPPERFCGLCSADIGEIVAENGVDAKAEESALDVRVFANGSTRWTERVALRSADGGPIEAGPERLERIVRSARESRWVLVDNPDSMEIAVEGQFLTATYWVEGAATERVGGVVLFEGFHTEPRSTTMEADLLTVTGPEGTTVENRVPGATVGGQTARWSPVGTGQGPPGARTYVAFAPSDGLTGTIAGAVAVGTAAGPPMIADAVAVGAPAAVAVLLLAGVVRLLGRDPIDRRWQGYALSTLAIAASAGLQLVTVASVALGAPALNVLGFAATPLAVVGLLSKSDRRTTALAAVLLLWSPVLTALAFVPASGFGTGFYALSHLLVVALTTAPVLLGYTGIALLERRAPS